jgi:hypothetical protein
MKTRDVKALVEEVLDALPRPHSEHVIDEVFSAIEHETRWRRVYESLCGSLGKTVVNNWAGFWTATALGKTGERQVPARKSTLIGSYSILDADAKPVLPKPTEADALELMAAYYRTHRDELPRDVRAHRDQILELLMEGVPAAEAFALATGARKIQGGAC